MTEETDIEQVDLNDLSYFWLPNGAPCFLANRKDICEQVEGLGFQIYYLIANEETEKSTPNKSTTTMGSSGVTTYTYSQKEYSGKILKVVKNIVGRAVSAVEDDLGKDLLNFKEEASYSLPPIPRAMVNKLDEFFRLVEAQHGTESIVILTFDPTKEGSEGWGILVPDQTNTAAHCKYDPDSIAALKDDHVIIVGSVHSHPGMAAYASGTDHEDQADFDGLHITYGWQNSVSNGMTQYHAELQMGGTSFVIDIDDIFESFSIEKDPDPDVVEWTGKVKKVPAPALGAYTTAPHTYNVGKSGISQTAYTGVGTTSAYDYGSRFVQKRTQNIPAIVKDSIPQNAVIVAEIDTREISKMLCPSCGLSLFKNEIYLGSSCPSCDLPIVSANSHVNNIIHSVNGYQNKRNRSCEAPYYLWAKGYNNGKEHTVLLIKEEFKGYSSVKGDDSDRLSMPAVDDDDSALQYDLRKQYEDASANENKQFSSIEFELEFWATRTWCCDRDLFDSSLADCDCKEPVTDESATDFDHFCVNENLQVYKKDSDCESCVFWYTGACPGYRQGVVDFKRSYHKPTHVIIDHVEQNLNLEACEKWESFQGRESHMEAIEMEMPYDNTY